MDENLLKKVIEAVSKISHLDPENRVVATSQADTTIKSLNRDRWKTTDPFVQDVKDAMKTPAFVQAVPEKMFRDAVKVFKPLLRGINDGEIKAAYTKKEDAPAAPVGTTTTTANVAPYPIPIGTVLRPGDRKKKKKHEEMIDWSSQFARSFENFSEAKTKNGYDLALIYEGLKVSK